MAEKEQQTNILFRFLSLFKPYLLICIVGFCLILFEIIISFPRPLFFKYIVDTIIPNQDYKMLIAFVALTVGSLFFQNLSSLLQSMIFINVRKTFLSDLRLKVYEHIQNFSQINFSNKKTGDIISRILLDIEALQDLMIDKYLFLLKDILYSICIIGAMIFLDIRMASFSLLIIPLFFIVFNVFANNIYSLSELFQQKRENLTSSLQENLLGKKEIQAFNVNEEKLEAIGQHIIKSEHLRRKRDLQTAVANFMATNINVVSIIVLWGVGGYLIIQGKFTIGSLIAFTNFYNMLFIPFSRIFSTNIAFQTSLASAKRVFELLDEKSEILEGTDELIVGAGNVKFDDVTFSYDKKNNILNNVSLELNPGEIVGLVGSSGTGKSTLVALLTRFIDVDKGKITIDDQNISCVTFKSLRDNIGILHQDVFLFNESIKDNITLGRDISTPDLVEVINILGLDEICNTLPEGINTKVGENGKNLSGGQKQRIAVARILVKKPKILIFDEPSTALDNISEDIIKDILFKLKNNHTILLISHSSSTLEIADKIYEIKNSEVYLKNKGKK